MSEGTESDPTTRRMAAAAKAGGRRARLGSPRAWGWCSPSRRCCPSRPRSRLVLLATQVFGFRGSAAVAASTLVAVALFSPLRRRVQHGVDRRFNRARYDAEQTVTEFAARLQDAVDPDVVRADLAGVVHAALEPTHVLLWLSQ